MAIPKPEIEKIIMESLQKNEIMSIYSNYDEIEKNF